MSKKVSVISLGGTISMMPAADGTEDPLAGSSIGAEDPLAGSSIGGVTPRLTAAEQLAGIAGLADTGIKVSATALRAVPGGSLTFDDLAAVVDAARAELDRGADGVVVTQGTDTIEETAFFLDLLLDKESGPVIVTGAMRHPTLAGADGPANLLAAIMVAADQAARGLGALVVFADEIHLARYVHKGHTMSTGTFASPGFGPLGWVVEGRVRLAYRPASSPTLPVPPALDTGDWPTVGLYVASLGDDGKSLRAMGSGLDGLVVAGFGAGHVPASTVPALAELAARIPVLLASRTGGGAIFTDTYGSPGSERDLLGRGLLDTGFLDPYKARILLTLLLRIGADRELIREIVAQFG